MLGIELQPVTCMASLLILAYYFSDSTDILKYICQITKICQLEFYELNHYDFTKYPTSNKSLKTCYVLARSMKRKD